MTWDQWLWDLGIRERRFVDLAPKDSVERRNVLALQLLSERLTKRCANPFCGWPISALREHNYSAPFIGDICATCHDLYAAVSIMNPLLSFSRYFHNAHDEWVKEQGEFKRKRRDLGLE